jgi:hypothetical protein
MSNIDYETRSKSCDLVAHTHFGPKEGLKHLHQAPLIGYRLAWVVPQIMHAALLVAV